MPAVGFGPPVHGHIEIGNAKILRFPEFTQAGFLTKFADHGHGGSFTLLDGTSGYLKPRIWMHRVREYKQASVVDHVRHYFLNGRLNHVWTA